MDQITKQLIKIHSIKGIGDQTIIKLFQKTTDLDMIISEIKKGTLFGIKKPDEYTFLSDAEIEKQYNIVCKHQVQLVPYYHPNYPKKLMDLTDPPAILYCRGDITALSKTSVSVIGTRGYSFYGKQVSELIIPQLVQSGMVIVSGLALGIDALAHEITLKSSGVGIAVLGSGIDVIAPVSNARLADDLINHKGCIISEFPIGTMPSHYTFPQRNRIIAALSEGTLIIEAGEKSGSLMTAEFALDLGRDVFAVPGSILSSTSLGTNRLIDNGAKIVTSPADILMEYGINADSPAKLIELEFDCELERKVYELIKSDPIFIDDLIEQANENVSNVVTMISQLEYKRYITRLNGDYFTRRIF